MIEGQQSGGGKQYKTSHVLYETWVIFLLVPENKTMEQIRSLYDRAEDKMVEKATDLGWLTSNDSSFNGTGGQIPFHTLGGGFHAAFYMHMEDANR